MAIPYVGPSFRHSPGNNKPINRIVIHSTVGASKAGSARGVGAYFRSSAAHGSAHYVVDAAEVVQPVYDGVIAWHAPPNPHSLGVEMCDYPSQDVHRWADADHQAVLRRTAALVRSLADEYGVPLVQLNADDLRAGKHGICGHHDVSQAFHQSTHWDPGAFPWDEFMRLVSDDSSKPTPTPPKEEDDMPAPKDWDDTDWAAVGSHMTAVLGKVILDLGTAGKSNLLNVLRDIRAAVVK